MSFFEEFGRKKKENEASLNPAAAVEKKGPTLKELMASDENSRLFGAYLENEGDGELGKRYAKGETTTDDIKELGDRRKEFLDVMDKVENVKSTLDAKTVQEMVEASPELSKIADLVGPEGIRAIVLKNIAELAFREPDRFEEIRSANEALLDVRKNLGQNEMVIRQICNKYDLTEGEYAEALQSSDPDALKKLAKEKAGGFFKGKARVARAYRELNNKAAIERLMQEHEDELRSVGEVLEGTIMKDEKLRKQLVASIRGERGEKENDELSVRELKDKLTAKMDKKKLKEDFDKEWGDYKNEHEKDPGFDEKTELDKFRKDFAEKRARKQVNNKKGFWGNIFSTIFSARLEDALK